MAEDEVVELCSDLIRIDTTNPGDNSGAGESGGRRVRRGEARRSRARGRRSDESHDGTGERRRADRGDRSGRDALLIHGHLDVVPFDAGDWRHASALGGRWPTGVSGGVGPST